MDPAVTQPEFSFSPILAWWILLEWPSRRLLAQSDQIPTWVDFTLIDNVALQTLENSIAVLPLGSTHSVTLAIADQAESIPLTLHRFSTGVLIDAREPSSDSIISSAEVEKRARSEFLASISHELRLPLEGVLGMLELTLGEQLSTPQRTRLGIARESATVLMALLNDLIAWSKMEAGKLTLSQVPFDLMEELSRVVENASVRVNQKGLDLLCDFALDLPQIIVADPDRLRQVLMNLLSNAIHFTDVGSVIVRVRAGHNSSGDKELRFSIVDTGVGIAPDKLGRIFEPFAPMDSLSTRHAGGTGMGLSIAHRLVQMMGGNLQATSHPNEGSSFSFTIPVRAMTGLQDRGFRILAPYAGRTLIWASSNPRESPILDRFFQAAGFIVEHVTMVPDSRELLVVDERLMGWQTYRGPMLVISRLGASAVPGRAYIARPLTPRRLVQTLIELLQGMMKSPTKLVGTLRPGAKFDLTAAAQARGKRFGKLIQLFRVEGPAMMLSVHACAARNDIEGLARAAHKLAGSVSYFLIPSLTQAVRQLELLAPLGNLAQVAHHLEILDGAMYNLEQAFQGYQAEHPSSD